MDVTGFDSSGSVPTRQLQFFFFFSNKTVDGGVIYLLQCLIPL